MTTPITESSLTDLLLEAFPYSDSSDEAVEWAANVKKATEARWTLAREVALAQDMVNRAEYREGVTPEHWKEAHGELVRVRRQLWEAEGELLNLRSELERCVRRVRTGGANDETDEDEEALDVGSLRP